MAAIRIYSETNKKDLGILVNMYCESTGLDYMTHRIKTADRFVHIGWNSDMWFMDDQQQQAMAKLPGYDNYKPQSSMALEVYLSNGNTHAPDLGDSARARLAELWDSLQKPVAFRILEGDTPLGLKDL